MNSEATPIRRDRIPRSGGFLWGPERVAARVSLRELARAARVNDGFISRMENGQMIPKADEYQRIIAALKRLQAEKATATLPSSATIEG